MLFFLTSLEHSVTIGSITGSKIKSLHSVKVGDYLGRKVFNYRKLFQVSDKSIENQFRSCWWKILQLAHLQFHTQLLRECKLSNNISWRNVSWNTCPQYSISISLSLLYQFLSSFRFYRVLFPGCQRLLGLFNPNHQATDNNHEPHCQADSESFSNLCCRNEWFFTIAVMHCGTSFLLPFTQHRQSPTCQRLDG